ncbi:hypothetical protein SFRURICE_004667 [Spodoptera frugiperda]|nr:hypothetical protein SFRURICE_004667 [Spodoptera frugiperda]
MGVARHNKWQMTEVANRRSTTKSTDDERRTVENPNRQQLGRKLARHDHLAWSSSPGPPFFREFYLVFPKWIRESLITSYSCAVSTGARHLFKKGVFVDIVHVLCDLRLNC